MLASVPSWRINVLEEIDISAWGAPGVSAEPMGVFAAEGGDAQGELAGGVTGKRGVLLAVSRFINQW